MKTGSASSAALRLFVTGRTETGYFQLSQGMQTKEYQDVDRESGDVSLDPSEEDQPVLPVNWGGLEAESCIYMIRSATDAQQSNANSFIF